MCLIAFAYKAHPQYDLILATNRDEFYKRPTRPLRFWVDENEPEILAGKDLKAGGTWMGAHKDGRWAAVTNYRDLSKIKEHAPSRGELVLDYLKGHYSAFDYLQELSTKAEEYNGFNILVWDDEGFYHFSNHSNVVSKIKPGVHGLSNALLNTSWPKLEIATKGIEHIIQHDQIQKDALFDLLQNEQKAADDELPSTGIPKELEKAVSSIFIQTEGYGTRCSTVLLIGRDGTVDFTERSFKPGTKEVLEERSYNFKT